MCARVSVLVCVQMPAAVWETLRCHLADQSSLLSTVAENVRGLSLSSSERDNQLAGAWQHAVEDERARAASEAVERQRVDEVHVQQLQTYHALSGGFHLSLSLSLCIGLI